jgi:hypothetical protein
LKNENASFRAEDFEAMQSQICQQAKLDSRSMARNSFTDDYVLSENTL